MSNSNNNEFGCFTLVVILIVLAGIIGWILNLVKLCDADGGEIALRVLAAIFAPIGAIVGYF